MNALLNTLKVSAFKRTAALALAAAVCTLGAAPAEAGDWRGRGDDRRGRAAVGVEVEFGSHGRVGGIRDGWRGHRHEDECRETKVWVEPVYRTVCEKVWHPPVTKTVCEKVWVPDRYECRTVVRRGPRGRLIRYEERVLVCAGHYETVERVVEVCPGRWENVERRELVAAGHWEVRREPVRVAGGRYGDHRSEDFRIGFEWQKR